MIKCLMYRNDVSQILEDMFGDKIQLKYIETIEKLAEEVDREPVDLICWDFSLLDEEYPQAGETLRNNPNMCEAAFVCICRQDEISEEQAYNLLGSGVEDIICFPQSERLMRIRIENAIRRKSLMREVVRSRWLDYMDQRTASDKLLFMFEVDLCHNVVMDQRDSELARENFLPLEEYLGLGETGRYQELIHPDDLEKVKRELHPKAIREVLAVEAHEIAKQVQYRILDKRENWIWVNQELFCYADRTTGNQCFSAVYVQDAPLRDKELYEKALSSDVIVVAVLDLDRDILRQVYAGLPGIPKDVPNSYTDNYRSFFAKILVEEDRERANKLFAVDALRDGIKENGLLHYQFRAYFPDGIQRYVSIEVSPYEDSAGSLVLVVRDISKRVEQQTTQQQMVLSATATKEHLDTIMRINPQAMSTFRINLTEDTLTDGASVYTNLKKLQQKGTFSGYIQDALHYLCYESERQALIQQFSIENLIAEYEAGKPQVSLRHHYMISDKEERILVTIVSMMKNNVTGNIEGIVYTLDETREWYYENINRMLFSESNKGIVVINVGKSTFIMPQESRILSFPVTYEETDFQTGVQAIVDMFVIPEDRDIYLKNAELSTIVRHLDENGSYAFNSIWERDGRRMVMRLSCYYLDEAHEKIVGIAEDVTEVTKREQEQIEKYQRALEELEKANHAKSDFLSSMSHDIRTPLNAIINLTDMLHEEMDDPTQLQSDIQKIEVAGEFLLQLINDILDVSRIESGKMVLHPRVYTYDSFLNYIRGIIVPLCQDKDVEFILDEGPTALDIYMDRVRFHQIFFNILSNAVKYTPPGGMVKFQTTNNVIHDGILSCDFIITDTGCGMSPEFIARAFEPFEREDTQNAYVGTGLGLTICKRIVDLMGGTISIESEPGKGTKVTVHLDMQIATKEQREESQAELNTSYTFQSNQPVDGDCRILVVEDNAINREILMRMLEKKAYIVDTAENGKEAVEKVQQHDSDYYQLILMDVRMPVMDGLQATMLIRQEEDEKKSHLPIIAVTANAFEADVQECLESGMNAYLSKPISLNAVNEMIATYVHTRT